MVDSIWINLVFGMIYIICFVLDILTYPVYFIIQKPWRQGYPNDYKRAMLVESFSSSSHNEVHYKSNGKTYYNKINLCTEMEEMGVDTIEKMFNFLCSRYQNKPCIGTREIISINDDGLLAPGKSRKTYNMGGYSWLTYFDMFSKAMEFGRGIHALGFESRTKIVIYADTRGNH